MKNLNLNKISYPIKIKQKMFFDNRGFFQEIFLKKNLNLNVNFTAIAKSKKNVIRGLHFQTKKTSKQRFIYVVNGKILDVVINLKKGSRNFGKVSKFILEEGEALFYTELLCARLRMFIKKCSVLYHLEKYRNAKFESGIKFNDKKLKIKWRTKKPIFYLNEINHMAVLMNL